jgi:hypothetical protein
MAKAVGHRRQIRRSQQHDVALVRDRRQIRFHSDRFHHSVFPVKIFISFAAILSIFCVLLGYEPDEKQY